MTYHPLANDTGGTSGDCRAEADRIIQMLDRAIIEGMTEREQEFLDDIDSGPVSPKQLFWLRDIKDKYL
jgi:hypothetical protein